MYVLVWRRQFSWFFRVKNACHSDVSGTENAEFFRWFFFSCSPVLKRCRGKLCCLSWTQCSMIYWVIYDTYFSNIHFCGVRCTERETIHFLAETVFFPICSVALEALISWRLITITRSNCSSNFHWTRTTKTEENFPVISYYVWVEIYLLGSVWNTTFYIPLSRRICCSLCATSVVLPVLLFFFFCFSEVLNFFFIFYFCNSLCCSQ